MVAIAPHVALQSKLNTQLKWPRRAGSNPGPHHRGLYPVSNEKRLLCGAFFLTYAWRARRRVDDNAALFLVQSFYVAQGSSRNVGAALAALSTPNPGRKRG